MFKFRALTALAPASLLVSALMVTLSGCTGSSPGTDPQIRSRFERIQNEYEIIQSDLDDQRMAIDDLADQVNTLAEEGVAMGDGTSGATVASLRSADQQTAGEIRQLKEQIASLSDELRQLRVQTAENAIAAHQQSGRTAATEQAPDPQIAAASDPEPEPVVSRPRGTWYIAESGDTLSSIAEDHGVSVSAIVQANGLPSSNIRPNPGMRFLIPR